MEVEDKEKIAALKYYHDGVTSRTRLLFTVNGGAFAIVKLITPHPGKIDFLLGNLRLWHLAIGMSMVTVLLLMDGWRFAQIMKDHFLGDLVFHWPGKAMIISLGSVIVLGWLLACT